MGLCLLLYITYVPTEGSSKSFFKLNFQQDFSRFFKCVLPKKGDLVVVCNLKIMLI